MKLYFHFCLVIQTERAVFFFFFFFRPIIWRFSGWQDTAFLAASICVCLFSVFCTLFVAFYHIVPGGACAVSVITEITPMSSVFLLEITLMDNYTFFIVLLSCLKLLYIMYLLSSGPHGSAVIHFDISKLDKSPCRIIFL